MRSVRFSFVVVVALSSFPSSAQLMLKNGADLVMTGSAGSALVFPDASVQAKAAPADHGGTGNAATGADSFIGGGNGNTTTDDYNTIAGGRMNQAGDNAGTAVDVPYATVSGGYDNAATGHAAAIGGGSLNTAEGPHATIAGGRDNTALGNFSAIAGGEHNTVSGAYSVALGGQFNSASGSFSFAAGRRAQANYPGCFVWADDSTEDLVSPSGQTFLARASNGFFLYTNSTATMGVELGPNDGSWSSLSDRDAKTAIEPVDPVAALEKVAAMPVSTFSYKEGNPEVRHMGFMAQDFHAAFDVGSDDLKITTQDADGVAFAAIQGLNAKLESQLAQKQARIDDLEARLAAIEVRLAALER